MITLMENLMKVWHTIFSINSFFSPRVKNIFPIKLFYFIQDNKESCVMYNSNVRLSQRFIFNTYPVKRKN